MHATDALIARFAAIQAYGSINIVCQPDGSVRLYANRLLSATPPKVPTIQVDAPTLIEGLAGMVEAFGRESRSK